MKKRLGIALMALLTLVLLQVVSVSLGWINLPSDMAVFFGVATLGLCIIFGPWFYRVIYRKLMKDPITTSEEKKDA